MYTKPLRKFKLVIHKLALFSVLLLSHRKLYAAQRYDIHILLKDELPFTLQILTYVVEQKGCDLPASLFLEVQDVEHMVILYCEVMHHLQAVM